MAKKKEDMTEEELGRFNEAFEVFMAKRQELGGRMPIERDMKKDSTINVKQLVKDLGQDSFSGAVIAVNRELRKQSGGPERLWESLSREEKVKLKREDPDTLRKMWRRTWAAQTANEKQEQIYLSAEKPAKSPEVVVEVETPAEEATASEELGAVEAVEPVAEAVAEAVEVDEPVAIEQVETVEVEAEEEIVEQAEVEVEVEVTTEQTETEEVEMARRKKTEEARPARRKYSYEEVWSYVKEHGVLEMGEKAYLRYHSEHESPGMTTIVRKLGPRKYWPAQLECETPEEAEAIRGQLMAAEAEEAARPGEAGRRRRGKPTRDGSKKRAATPAKPKGVAEPQNESEPESPGASLSLTELNTLLESGGTISTLAKTTSSFEATWQIILTVDDLPVEITIKAKKEA